MRLSSSYRPMLSRVAIVAAYFNNRIDSLLINRRTVKTFQTGDEHPMDPYIQGLNHYGPLDDVDGNQSRLSTVRTTDAFRGGSVERLGHGEHNRIIVENTVEMV